MRQGQGLQCSFDQALIDEEKLRATGKFLLPALTALRAATKKGYVDECSSINFPVDTKTVRAVKAFAAKHRAVDLLIVVGIGGANLGPLAVEEALLGKLHNETGKPRVYFADTVDTAKIHRLNVILAEALRRNQRVLLNVISSSGTTTETIANFAVLFATMQAYEENAVVVVTTKRSSPLWKLATREGFETFVVPETVGDRYAIMSPVGLFPLAVLGVDVEELLQGAAAMREKCLSMDVLENPAAVGAIIQYLHHKGGRNLAELFLFAADFESVGKWWRQLLAESCGKEYDRAGKKRVWAGVTPTVSIGSTDLHSVGQLDLGGPQDKLTTFVTIGEEDVSQEVIVPDFPAFESLVPYLRGKSLQQIMCAIQEGTMHAYREGKRPYIHVELPSRSAYCVGQFLQWKMMETMLFASLLGVNPFDQPAVEQYKAETRRILAGK